MKDRIVKEYVGFHDESYYARLLDITPAETKFTYTFGNFFHPFVGQFIAKLNKESLIGMLDPLFHESLSQSTDSPPKDNTFFTYFKDFYQKPDDNLVAMEGYPKEVDVTRGPYANYNWELLFHAPLTIAVHLTKNQRFAEARRWFHYIFDPTSRDQSLEPSKRFWRFIAFRDGQNKMRIDEIVGVLSIPRSQLSKPDQDVHDSVLTDYNAILNKPFQPHVVARTRPLAYECCVVMKYLDNLIAWGDALFQQYTIETINEATQLYVLAANILGQRPQQIPRIGTIQHRTFAQLRKDGLGPIGNGFAELQAQLPLNLTMPGSGIGGDETVSSSLFGIGRTLYFCIPPNQKLLGYWDTVADRLFKIRHCMNIEGVVRPLALWDPPLDPGMLVRAAAAGIDVSSIVNGLTQPVSPVRCLFLIPKALELCAEVRALGNALLSALEKGDAEHLALLRQGHEVKIQQAAQDVRFLQWASAQEATKSLVTSRRAALERLHYYKRLLGLPPDPNAPDNLEIDFSTVQLTEEGFAEAYDKLVQQYDKGLTLKELSSIQLEGDTSPAQGAGITGQGNLCLNVNEAVDINVHSRDAQDSRDWASRMEMSASTLASIPGFSIKMHFWGLGGSADIPMGTILSNAARAVSSHFSNNAQSHDRSGQNASKSASYQRRADDWILQHNLAAHDLMQNGRQILTSLIGEQITHHEYVNLQKQIKNSEEVEQILKEKFTNKDLYLWMQGETSRLYYEYYRLACETARKAEKAMKQELMRPEVDKQDFVKFNYWDGGRKGLLAGEALQLDLKRMEMAYHESNKRELELTKHVSLRQLDPVALLTLKATGSCQATIPEWLYDIDCPGHYMRRIKHVGLSIPCIVGPYTSVNCTLSLLRSSLRKSSIAGQDYARQASDDERFIDYSGAVQSIVTSTGQNDSGLFETNLQDERLLPFEGAGAVSTWILDLPKDYRSFDYNSISDVILHIRYTARQGLNPTKVIAAVDGVMGGNTNEGNPLALLFSLRHDFPNEWATFNRDSGDQAPGDLSVVIRTEYHFPYFVSYLIQRKKSITVKVPKLYGLDGAEVKSQPIKSATDELSGKGQYTVVAEAMDNGVLNRNATDVFLVVPYTID